MTLTAPEDSARSQVPRAVVLFSLFAVDVPRFVLQPMRVNSEPHSPLINPGHGAAAARASEASAMVCPDRANAAKIARAVISAIGGSH